MPLTRSVFLLAALLGVVAATTPSPAAPPVDAARPQDDREPPSQPTDLQALLRPGDTVHLSWIESSDDVGVREYRVYRDGGLIGTSGATEYLDRGVRPGRYSYTVAAVDEAGYESRRSRAAEVIAR